MALDIARFHAEHWRKLRIQNQPRSRAVSHFCSVAYLYVLLLGHFAKLP